MSADIIKVKKPSFIKDKGDDIFLLLRTEAKKIVALLEPVRKKEILFKAFLFPSVYFLLWGSALIYGNNSWILYSCYFTMGLFIVLNYLNIIHDAVHHTIFKSRGMNDAYAYIFDIMGANSYIWETRHIRYHHNYPNVGEWDTDIDQSPIVRILPRSGISRLHRYQHIYMPFIYPLFLFNWLLVRDFKDFFGKNRTVRKLVSIPKIEYVKLLFFKSVFITYLLIIPKIVLGITWIKIIGAFVILVLTASIFSLIVLLPPHANIESEFPVPDRNKKLPYGWFLHMLKTANDVDGENWFTRFVLGNYNYHVVHHLFPNIHHVYYPEIVKVLKKFATEYNLPYRSYPLFRTLKNHHLLLKQRSSDFNIWEEDM